MLLPFINIKHPAVCERAVARIAKLADLMASSSSVQVWSLLGHDHSSSHHDISKDCLLGQLLGRLIVCWTSKIWAIQQEALVALHHLSIFIQHQKCMTSPQPDNCHDHPEHPQAGGKREAGKPSCLSLCSTISMAKVMSFFLAGPLVWGIRTRLVQAKGSRTSGLGMTSLSLVRGLLLFWSRDFRGLHSRVPPLSPRDLSSYPLLRNDCSPCCQLSRGSSRQSCSHCPAEQHYQGTQCNTSSPPSSFLQAFEEYLHPADKTVIILRAIQATRDSCVCDKEELISVLNVAMTEPASWLTEVRIITRCIYNNLQHISAASARCSLKSLFLSMAEQKPREMILSLIDISPACNSKVAQAMWEALLSQPLILVKVLRELRRNLQHLQLRIRHGFCRVKFCIRLLALLACSDVTPEEFAGVYNREKFPWCQNVVLFSLTLTGLITLSQSPDTVSRA
ncbi:uncharacterized protein LOC133278198 [Pezoporus flaviventris]|uniref:uncharacterized protein LOC133278198 n=1 Tax=Pezoporus flaviventris TaxID=889875 RepID=UPI002AB05E96|nr:uncharacterized protein LOC133278198 [Pezoporus flaviventris]